ncbi:FecCD family ABC transporter permease [Rhodococcoides yunnanense]|uniref:FecCD family ABC transporter permease n=1 Tax=Rhodococcoides yunnanense TaxID=278209 RepID=UPI001FE480AD|nr:iron chelate uptake ABC transporter family permease subunit [Rhodococcus yunnanensis]
MSLFHVGDRVSVRVHRRVIKICLLLGVLCLGLVVLGLVSGSSNISFGEVVRVLLGDEESRHRVTIIEWRLPRVLLALTLGAALGLSGAIFQSITRNPLGSPDIIGFGMGSYAGVLVVTLVWGSGYVGRTGGAIIGGLVTAVVVYLLAFNGGVRSFRLIIVGIAMAEFLGSITSYLMLRSDVQLSHAVAMWGAGSLNGLGWKQAFPAMVIMVLSVPALVWAGRALRMLELGDDSAKAFGIAVERNRSALIFLGVGLTALCTAAAGPIAFIALAAPQIVRRLNGGVSVSLGSAAAMGAFMLGASDWIAENALPTRVPVGVVTVSVGGMYLVWLLVRESRREA